MKIEGMKQISKEKFYKYINPRDICVTSKGFDYSRFETRERVEVGRCYWHANGTKTYYLREDLEAYNETK